MVKLHLELEGDVGEVVRVLRRIGGGDNAGGEVRDGPRPALAEERTSAVDTVPELGTTATSATLVPGRWRRSWLPTSGRRGQRVMLVPGRWTEEIWLLTSRRVWTSWPDG